MFLRMQIDTDEGTKEGGILLIHERCQHGLSCVQKQAEPMKDPSMTLSITYAS